MAKASPDKLGTSRPKVMPDDLDDDVDVALVTIAAFEEGEVDDNESASGKRYTAFLSFHELGEKVLYLNKTQMEYLIAGLGSDDTDDWADQQIPIERIKKQFGSKSFDKVWVVHNDEWGEHGLKTARRKRVAKTVTKKVAKKRTAKRKPRSRR